MLNRDELLAELLNLKELRRIELHRADSVTERQRFVKDLQKHKLSVSVRLYLKHRIAELDKSIGQYNLRERDYLSKSRNVQKLLPISLVLHTKYVDSAVDDLVTGRASDAKTLAALFYVREKASTDEANAILESGDKDRISLVRLL